MSSSSDLKEFTLEEVQQHNSEGDLWIIIDSNVYDVSKFANLHPGGSVVLLDPAVAGKDATDAFFGLHRLEVLQKPAYKRLVIGTIKGQRSRIHIPVPGEMSRVPYAEPSWLVPNFSSPYYTDAHKRLAKAMREWVDRRLAPEAAAREADGKYISKSIIKESCDLGIMAMRMGPGPHLKPFKLMGGGVIEPEEFDYFAEMIVTQELAHHGQRGFADGNLAGNVIGLPPVMNFARPEIRDRVMREVLTGEKVISLAISEAFAGSDVAGLKCTAVKSPDGKHYIVNGTKKWITTGMFSDYFSVGCRTSANGLTMFLIERGEGVTTKQIKTSYSTTAGTAFIEFKNVKVPVENVLGKVDKGLLVILSNFNHERLVMCAGSARISRMVVEECLKWANQRKVFGKPLTAQPVTRQQLASMIAHVESIQSWLESITYQMNKMSYKQQSENLAGPIALLKYQCTRAEHDIADKAVQIFGGRGITQTGMGTKIEMHQRTYKFNAILGGSEEILADLAVRQALRSFPQDYRL